MGLFSRKKDAEFVPVPGEQLFVGEASYQPELLRLLTSRGHSAEACKTRGKSFREEFVANLVPEPTNTYDANAVAVKVSGVTVAYLSRANAVNYRKAFGTQVGEVPVKVQSGSGSKAMLSVWPA